MFRLKLALVLFLISGIALPCFSQDKSSNTNYDLLLDSQAAVRRDAVNALAEEQKQENLSYIIRMLKDVDLEVQKAAINAMIRFKDSGVVKPLVEKFNSTNEADIKMSVILALGDLKSDVSIPFLKTILNDSYPANRNGALRALGKINKPETYIDIANMLTDEAEGVRVTAAKLVGKYKIDSGMPLLIKNLQDPAPIVRVTCIEALGDIGDTSAVSNLKKLLKDQNRIVVDAAKKSLEKIKKNR